jgi:hypothetical protein
MNRTIEKSSKWRASLLVSLSDREWGRGYDVFHKRDQRKAVTSSRQHTTLIREEKDGWGE